jgi:hypothetical protein
VPDAAVPDASAPGRLPLSALLSQALVAFTIEFDNEAERHIRHRTTRLGGPRDGVWLVSMAMWLNCMRYLGTDPIRVGEIASKARCGTNLDGMRRWGYLTLEPDPADSRPKPPDRDLLARPTVRGMRAREVWEPLTDVIEQRWRDRFGATQIEKLTATLQAIADQLADGLPDCLPILGYGLLTISKLHNMRRYLAAQARPAANNKAPLAAAGAAGAAAAAAAAPASRLPLPWLLARVLLAFAIEFEHEGQLSLAISANLLRLLDEDGTRVRDLPVLSGVSTEGLAMATGFTGARKLTVTESDAAGGKWRVARLTPKGAAAKQTYADLTGKIEQRWHARFDGVAVTTLRLVLEELAGDSGPGSPLFACLEPDPSGWRATVRKPVTLPHYPMVLHRGGFPDGS